MYVNLDMYTITLTMLLVACCFTCYNTHCQQTRPMYLTKVKNSLSIDMTTVCVHLDRCTIVCTMLFITIFDISFVASIKTSQYTPALY